MKPLIVLIVTFVILLIFNYMTDASGLIPSSNIAMCVMLCFTAIGHFKFTKGMEMMIPQPIPYKRVLVYVTGILEVVLGNLLLFEEFRRAAGVVLVIFFMLMLPANIYAATNRVNYEKASYDGKGVGYLWFRIPMQVFLILWVWYFSIDKL